MTKLNGLILLLLLFTCTAKAQENLETKKFLSDVFRDKLTQEVFTYTDKIWPAYYDNIERSLKADTLQGALFPYRRDTPKEYIVLSKQEKVYIFKCLQEQKTKAWPDNLFPKSRLILYDTITAIFKDRRRGWPYFNNHFARSGFHSFTQPIFLRNNSLCIFYSDYSCGGLCGSGEFAVYRKQNGVWIKIISLYSWIS